MSIDDQPTSEIQVVKPQRHSKLAVIVLAIILVFGFVLLNATNPSESDYDTYLENQVIQGFNGNPIASGLTKLFGGSLIDSSTTRTNYTILSTYKTAIDANHSLAYLGILEHFIPISNNNISSGSTATNTSSNQDASGGSVANTPDNSSNNSPFAFNGTYPQSVTADSPANLNFSITNNTDTPFIQANLEFENMDGVTITLGSGWTLNKGGLFSNPSIEEDNILINKGQSLSSSFSFEIAQPGTYQFKILPKVMAGDWQTVGTYVISLNVQDSPEAQQQRSDQASYKQVGNNLDQVNSQIQNIEYKISDIQFSIADEKESISVDKQCIATNQNVLSQGYSSTSDINSLNQQIQDYNQKIQDSNNKIAQYQSQIDQLNSTLSGLKQQQQSLESQKSSLQSELSQ